jgi:hypothetical protein
VKASDFSPGQVVTYRGRYAGARTFSGVVVADDEHACRECPTYIHVQTEDQRNPGLHHVDPECVRTVDGKAVES